MGLLTTECWPRVLKTERGTRYHNLWSCTSFITRVLNAFALHLTTVLDNPCSSLCYPCLHVCHPCSLLFPWTSSLATHTVPHATAASPPFSSTHLDSASQRICHKKCRLSPPTHLPPHMQPLLSFTCSDFRRRRKWVFVSVPPFFKHHLFVTHQFRHSFFLSLSCSLLPFFCMSSLCFSINLLIFSLFPHSYIPLHMYIVSFSSLWFFYFHFLFIHLSWQSFPYSLIF